MGSRFISFGVYLRIPEVVDAGRMPLPRDVAVPVCGDTKMRSRCGYHALATFFVNPEERSSGKICAKLHAARTRDLEKYPPPFAAANMKYHATDVEIRIIMHFVPKSPSFPKPSETRRLLG